MLVYRNCGIIVVKFKFGWAVEGRRGRLAVSIGGRKRRRIFNISKRHLASETNQNQQQATSRQQLAARLHFPQKISTANFCNLVFGKTAGSLPTSDSPSYHLLVLISHIKALRNILKHGVGRKILTDYAAYTMD
jgi:hypothetical protein